MEKLVINNQVWARAIVDRMKKAAGVRTYSELGDALNGISSPAISKAIGKGTIPPAWFDIIQEKFGLSKQELTRPLEPIEAGVRFSVAESVPATSVHRELSIIRAVLRWAVSRRLIAHNPMEGYPMPTRDDAVLQPPTSAELAAIHAAAAPHLQRAILLAAYTGMRPGSSELLGLRWQAVDLINGTIFVESAKKGGMRARVVPIAAPLAEALQQWLRADREAGTMDFVVHYHGRRVARIKTAWRAALVRAGITRRIRPYDLRHLAASAMLDAGADLKSVSEILGHSSPDLTLRTYQHTSTALRRDAIARIGSLLPIDTSGEDGKSGK